MTWYYEGKEIGDDDIKGYTGFVYLITNTLTGKRYIGKKTFEFTRRKKLKGRAKKTVVRVESDWRDYYGSNGALLSDVLEHGPEHFTREILRLCKTKGSANYYEMKYQILNEVLETDGWYNDQIRARVHRSHIKS